MTDWSETDTKSDNNLDLASQAVGHHFQLPADRVSRCCSYSSLATRLVAWPSYCTRPTVRQVVWSLMSSTTRASAAGEGADKKSNPSCAGTVTLQRIHKCYNPNQSDS